MLDQPLAARGLRLSGRLVTVDDTGRAWGPAGEPVEIRVKNLPWKTVRAEVYGTDAERTEALVTGGTFSGDFSLILPVDGYSVRLLKLTPVE